MANKIDIHPKIQILIVYIVLTVVTLAVFWQVNQYDFVNFDDHIYVTENIHIQSGITLDGLRWAMSTMYAEFWHPLTWLSLMSDYQLFGLNAGGYHLTNLLLHILSTLLLFWLFNRMTGTVWRSAFIAALFALHPLHVESVAWIAERKDVLSAFWGMLTLCVYVYYTEKPVLRRYLPVLLCFSCALMSKSMVITLPVIMILLDYWPLDRLQSRESNTSPKPAAKASPNQKQPKNRLNKKALPGKITSSQNGKLSEKKLAGIIPLWQLREKLPLFFLSAVFSIITLYAHDTDPAIQFPFVARLANAFVSFAAYLGKIFWPQHLAVFYPFPDQYPAWQVGGAVFLIFVISVAAIIALKRLPYLFVGWLWYAIILLPVIGIIQIGDFAMADRYTYLASIGISIMLAWGIPPLFQRARIPRVVLLPAGIAVLTILAVLSWQQCRYWENSIELFSHALQVTRDNPLARNSLGVALASVGRNKEAIANYRAAVELNPYSDKAHSNLGLALVAEGKIDEAITHYRAAIDFNPNNEAAHLNIGSALALAGKHEEAADHYRTAMKLNLHSADTHNNFANLLLKQGKIEEATMHYRRAIEINPSNQEAYANLADIFVQQGKIAEAIEHYRQVLGINPSSFRALNNLGVNLEKQQRHDEAIDCYRRALKINPSNPGVHLNLGVALGNKGDLPAAIQHFRTAVALNPKFDQAGKMLKIAEQMQKENR